MGASDFRAWLAALGLLAAESLSAAHPAAMPAGLRRAIEPVTSGDIRSALPEGWQHGAFAEIYVRGYRDSDGDGIGDLRGLIQSLDYLRDLGVRGLWLMPVTASQDHDHGYSVSDFRAIESDYGTLADFDELLRQAHARGIGVIMDYVINHSAASNPLFEESARSPDSPLRNWFLWEDTAPEGWEIFGRNPWEKTEHGAYFAQFGRKMPDFNMLEPDVVRFHEDNLRFWLNRGVDGFRFDAVPHLVEHGPKDWYDQVEDHALMARFRTVVDGYSQRYIVCEATGNEKLYGSPEVCGGAFAIWQAPQPAKASSGDQASIRSIAYYYRDASPTMAMMASNHDKFAGLRLWDQVQGDGARYRLAAASYLLMPGTPFIFYGEEIGMAGATGIEGDGQLRIPMSWSAHAPAGGFSTIAPFRPNAANWPQQNVEAESASEGGLLAWYRALLALRNRYPSIARGSYEAASVQGKALAYQRRWQGERTLVAINYGKTSQRFRLSQLPSGGWEPILGHWPLEVDKKGRAVLRLPAQSVLAWRSAAEQEAQGQR